MNEHGGPEEQWYFEFVDEGPIPTDQTYARAELVAQSVVIEFIDPDGDDGR